MHSARTHPPVKRERRHGKSFTIKEKFHCCNNLLLFPVHMRPDFETHKTNHGNGPKQRFPEGIVERVFETVRQHYVLSILGRQHFLNFFLLPQIQGSFLPGSF